MLNKLFEITLSPEYVNLEFQAPDLENVNSFDLSNDGAQTAQIATILGYVTP